jgi:hypothetical protein
MSCVAPGSGRAGCARLTGVDYKLELVVVPVSDVDRAKAFYERAQASASTSTTGRARTSASCN